MSSGRRTGISNHSLLGNEVWTFENCRPIGTARDLAEYGARQGIKKELDPTVAEWTDQRS